MSPLAWSWTVWALWIGVFLALEIPAAFDVVPWNTFSWSVWQVSARSGLAALVVAAVIVDLALHLITGWPSHGGLRPRRQRTEGKR